MDRRQVRRPVVPAKECSDADHPSVLCCPHFFDAAPAKVDVDAEMAVVLDWCCPTKDAEDQLRARLTKLFNA